MFSRSFFDQVAFSVVFVSEAVLIDALQFSWLVETANLDEVNELFWYGFGPWSQSDLRGGPVARSSLGNRLSVA